MKKFIKEYLNIIAGSIIGFVFILASFYLVLNYYHSEELKSNIYISENDNKLVEYKETVNKIKNNLDIYSKTKHTNSRYDNVYQHLSTCYSVMIGKDLYYSIETNRFYTPNDLYYLGGKFQSEILNICWALHLSSLDSEKNPSDIKKIAPFVKSHVNTITGKTNEALEEIQNNSSYFFTTKVTSMTMRNYFRSDYNMITDSYREFADIILNLSNIINEGGNND